MKPATDKQIKCLFALQKRANAMAKKAGRNEHFTLDFYEERAKGMTAFDASEKINAFHSYCLGINVTQYLKCKPQL